MTSTGLVAAREDEHRLRIDSEGEAPRELAIGAALAIGRGPDNGLQLASPRVSRRHCRVFVVEGCCFVEDLGSAAGTQVEGRTITGPCALGHGARIRVGEVELVYCEAGRPSPSRGPGA